MALSIKLSDEQRSYAEFVPLENFVYSAHISLKHNYLYVQTPKAGHSTVKHALIRAELEDPEFQYPDTRLMHERSVSPLLSPLQVGDYAALFASNKLFKFCFVRNPYERLLSGYLDKIARPSEQRALLCRQLGLTNPVDQDLTFGEFVNAIYDQSPIEMDNHWRPQYYQTFQDKIEYDFIGRVESLRIDFLKVGKRLGVDLAPYLRDERNHGQGAGSRLAEFMTDEIQATILDKYQLDFETFGYDEALPEV